MKRDDLKRYKRLKEEISLLRWQIADLEDMAAPVAKWSDEPKAVGGVGDPVGEAIAKKEKLKALYLKRLHELLDLQEAIEKFVEGLDDGPKALVKVMYFKGRSFSESAEEVGITTKTVCQWLKKVFND